MPTLDVASRKSYIVSRTLIVQKLQSKPLASAYGSSGSLVNLILHSRSVMICLVSILEIYIRPKSTFISRYIVL